MYKLYIIVRTDIKFSIGKLMVHAGHIATVITEQLLGSEITSEQRKFYEWYEDGDKQTKIILKEHGLEDILHYVSKAQAKNILSGYVKDAGFYEVPKGTILMVGILCTEEEAVELGLDKLKLYG